jgi:hypothetical protein
MSFNRLPYDSCAYAKTLQQSTDPLDYNLYRGKFESCEQCVEGLYPNELDFGIRADVESDLKGQNRISSKCPSEKYPANSNSISEKLSVEKGFVKVQQYVRPAILEALKGLVKKEEVKE